MLDILNSIGLQDPHRQLQKELDSWDIWNIEETDRKKDLKKMCSQWLDRYFDLVFLCFAKLVQIFPLTKCSLFQRAERRSIFFPTMHSEMCHKKVIWLGFYLW